MIKHIFKLVWNQRRKYFILWLELLVMFMILYAGNVSLIRSIRYISEGVGSNIENVQLLNIQHNNDKEKSKVQNQLFELKRQLENHPSVEAVTVSCNASPYIWSSSSSYLTYGEKKRVVHCRMADEDFNKVMGMELIKGRWFDAKDTSKAIAPLIICQNAVNRIFGNGDPIGKEVEYWDQKWKIIGVISHMKRNDYETSFPTIIMPITRSNWLDWKRTNFLLKLKPNSYIVPKELKSNVFSTINPADFNIVESALLKHKKSEANKGSRNEVLMTIIIIAFLIFNIVLGLIGIVSNSVNRRVSELGIRRALGSNSIGLKQLIIGEMWVITFLAFIPGLIIILNGELLSGRPNENMVLCILFSFLAMLLFVTISALYPAIKASRVQPALALKGD